MNNEFIVLKNNELDEVNGGGLIGALGGLSVGGLYGSGVGMFSLMSGGDVKSFKAAVLTGCMTGAAIGMCLPEP